MAERSLAILVLTYHPGARAFVHMHFKPLSELKTTFRTSLSAAHQTKPDTRATHAMVAITEEKRRDRSDEAVEVAPAGGDFAPLHDF